MFLSTVFAEAATIYLSFQGNVEFFKGQTRKVDSF